LDYLSFYNLDAEPFQNEPDTRFYYASDAQQQARLRLMRGVQQRKALSLLIAGPGCGKTTLAHHLLENLDSKKWAVRMAVIPHAACPSGWLIRSVAKSFGVAQPANDALAALAQLSQLLVDLAAGGAGAVLLIDEAQLLSNKAVLEDFRALLNLVHEGRKLLSLVLFGLPLLDEVLRVEVSLGQRIEIRAEMPPMDREQSAAYVQHRITCVNGAREIFSLDAVDALYTYSGGVPRVINTLADNALFEGAVEQSRAISRTHIIAAADQLGLEACVTPASRVNQFRPGAPRSKPEMPLRLERELAPALAEPAPESEPVAPEPLPEDDDLEAHAETLTAISLTEDDDTCVSMEQLIARMDEDEPAAVEREAAPGLLKRKIAASAQESPALKSKTAAAGPEALVEGSQGPEEVELAVPRATRNESPLLLEQEDESLDTMDKFESLWSEIEGNDRSGLPPAAAIPPKQAPQSLSKDEESTVVGLQPEHVTTPQSAVGRSAQATADEIDALFDDISIDD